MNHPESIFITFTVASLLVGGCAKEPESPRVRADGTHPERMEAHPGHQTSDHVRATVEPTLVAYENIRANLAADDIAGAGGRASTLEHAATKAAADAPKGVRAHLSGIAQAARGLGQAPTDDPDAVRKAFGEVSRSVVALLGAEPSLRERLYVFECSMAQGFQKWVQPTDTIENPYMGQQMLECGSAVKWAD